jgi:hypothetical protein
VTSGRVPRLTLIKRWVKRGGRSLPTLPIKGGIPPLYLECLSDLWCFDEWEEPFSTHMEAAHVGQLSIAANTALLDAYEVVRPCPSLTVADANVPHDRQEQRFPRRPKPGVKPCKCATCAPPATPTKKRGRPPGSKSRVSQNAPWRRAIAERIAARRAKSW